MRHRTTAVTLTLLTLGLLAAGIADAETLYRVKERVDVETEGGVDELVIAINAALVSPLTRVLGFELSNGVVVEATMTSSELRGADSVDGNVVWRGTFAGNEGYRVTLTRIGSTVAGYFDSESGPHVIVGPAGDQRLVLLEPSLFGECATVSERRESLAEASTLAPDYSGAEYQPGVGEGELIEVGVLGLYTENARAQAGGPTAIEAKLQSALDIANTALNDSESRLRYRLVHMDLFEHNDTERADDDLANLMASSRVATLRDNFGADLVGLMVAILPGSCGKASDVLTSPKGDPNVAYQVTRASCPHAFAHELGHLVGMNHEPERGLPPAQALYPWAFAHYDSFVGFQTVMATIFTCPSCTVIHHFSNPDVDYVSVPTGIAGERDNARTADLIAPVIASYRTAPSRPSGTLEVADCSTIAGWARDVDNTQPIRVRISHDGNVLATVVADGFRADLPFPDKNHGFSIPTPPELATGEVETIRAFALDVDRQGQETGSTVELSSSPKTLVCGSAPRLVASYIPFEGGARTELVSTSANPPSFDFYYEQFLGNFERRPGGICHQGQNNPTYLKLRYEGPDIESCTFQASWNSGPSTCSEGIIDRLNSQHVFVINTDFLATDPHPGSPQFCQLFSPPIVHLPFNQNGWFRIDLTTTDGLFFARRLNFRKFREVPTPH